MVDGTKAKGNELETAVELIERTILRTNKSLKEENLKIEAKKVMIIDDERYEIDLYVEIDLGIGSKLIYIFECKNWESKVDPKEIIYFSEKIKVCNAQMGYFIAKDFTKYAVKKAKKDKRIELLYAKENFLNVGVFPHIHGIFNKPTKVEVHINAYGQKPGGVKKVKELNPSDVSVKYNGKEIILKELLDSYLKQVMGERLKHEPTQNFDVGIYPYNHKMKFEFKPKELCFIEGKDIEFIEMRVEFEMHVLKQIVVSKFDIENKGRFINYEYKMPTGTKLKLAVVSIPATLGKKG